MTGCDYHEKNQDGVSVVDSIDKELGGEINTSDKINQAFSIYN